MQMIITVIIHLPCGDGCTNGVSLSVHVTPGFGTLKIDFVGELNDKMKGFYRSKYTSPTGEIRYAAVTQFEVSEWPQWKILEEVVCNA